MCASTTSNAALNELMESWVPPLKEPDIATPDIDIEMLDRDARWNLKQAFSLVPASVARQPSIAYVYYKQNFTAISTVPVDLQLA